MTNPLIEKLRYHVSGAIERGKAEPITEVRGLPTTLPFEGFCESVHSDNLERELEMMVSNDSGIPNDRLLEIAWDGVDWCKAHHAYAKLYAARYSDWTGIRFTFDELNSPREYNFTTDRIFVYVDADDVRKMRAKCDDAELAKLVADKFTRRSGFISYYSPCLEDWPEDATEWDHNQIGTLVECFASDITDIMEDAGCNGEYDEILYDAMNDKAKQAVNVASYLRRREERKYRKP